MRTINKSLDQTMLIFHLNTIMTEHPNEFTRDLLVELEKAREYNQVQNARVKRLFNEICPGKSYANDTELYRRLRHIYFRNIHLQIQQLKLDGQDVSFNDDFECSELSPKDLQDLRQLK